MSDFRASLVAALCSLAIAGGALAQDELQGISAEELRGGQAQGEIELERPACADLVRDLGRQYGALVEAESRVEGLRSYTIGDGIAGSWRDALVGTCRYWVAYQAYCESRADPIGSLDRCHGVTAEGMDFLPGRDRPRNQAVEFFDFAIGQLDEELLPIMMPPAPGPGGVVGAVSAGVREALNDEAQAARRDFLRLRGKAE